MVVEWKNHRHELCARDRKVAALTHYSVIFTQELASLTLVMPEAVSLCTRCGHSLSLTPLQRSNDLTSPGANTISRVIAENREDPSKLDAEIAQVLAVLGKLN